MDYQALFSRILQTVDEGAYLTPTSSVDPRQRPAIDEIRAALAAADLDPDSLKLTIKRMCVEGRIDRVNMLSALHVLAASPRVQDWTEAARLAGEQELAALDLGGTWLEANLASVDRHRGVLAFLRGHYAMALDHLTRALERQRTPENLGNVLCALLRLGELDEADGILAQARNHLPATFVADLDARIASDPDLSVLREEAS